MEKISRSQRAVADEITAKGRELGVEQHLIEAAVKFAYFESRLGRHMTNGNALGLFQYMPNRWRERHRSLGDRSSSKNQIVAMFRDLQDYERRYNDLSNPKIPRTTLTLEEYLYVKHHDGPNSGDFRPRIIKSGHPNGLRVYRDNNPNYDASVIFPPEKTGIAPIRNPWEVTFGPLPGMSAIDWSGLSAEIERGQAIMANLGGSTASSSANGVAPLTPQTWPVITDNNRWTPPPPPASDGRSYIDTHHFDPDTGASVSTRRRMRREAGLLAEAMAGAVTQPPLAGVDAGAVPFTPVALRQLASVLANSMTAIP